MFKRFKINYPYLVSKYRHDSADPATGLPPDELTKALPAFNAPPNMPTPVKKAKAFEFLCRNMRIDVSSHDFFPTFGCWDRNHRPMGALIAEWDKKVAAEKLHFNDIRDSGNRSGDFMLWVDFDHSVPDWDALFELGFPGIMQRINDAEQNCRQAGGLTPAADAYFTGLRISWEAALMLLQRFIAKARQEEAAHPEVAVVADCIEQLTRGVPQNTYEALMLIYMFFFISEHLDHMQVRSLGNLDDRLCPFIRRDMANDIFTEAQIRELLSYFMMQWGSINNYWGQPFYLGGTAPDGSSLYNPASRMILEEYDKLDIISPKIQMKVAKNTPDDIIHLAFDLIRRNRNVVFVCEPGMKLAMNKLGFSDEEARTCDISGCYEYCPRGTAAVTAVGYVNLLKPFEHWPFHNPKSFDDFFAEYWDALKKKLEDVIRIADDFELHLAEINPAQIFSATIGNSLKTARDAFADGSQYNNTSLLCSGLASASDALAMIQKFVYHEHLLTLEEWHDILQNNWQGAEEFRQRVLNSPERYGNHSKESDTITGKLALRLDRLINGRPNARGGIWHVSAHAARGFIILGEKTAATPDGRRAGEEMSKNISPVNGMDRQGVTALLESAVQIAGAIRFPGDSCLDVMLHPSTVDGDEGFATLKMLLDYYMKHGGHALQFNIFNPETLHDAQEHPEKYGSLMVRVCGWNTRFNDMSRVEQNAYIERAVKIME